MSKVNDANGLEPRQRILDTATDLFYRQGVHAVGINLVIEVAGVAKASLYRHFRTKDDLIAAFLEREDRDFWDHWDRVAKGHLDDACSELKAHLGWIGKRVSRSNYRGCPQINVAAEFPDSDHPARKVASAHKAELTSRLRIIAKRLGAKRPDELAAQLAVLINGAFVSSQILKPHEAATILQHAADAMIQAGRR